MTNEEKAKILSGMVLGFNDKASKEQYDIAIKMAEWKDEQQQELIDRACELFKKELIQFENILYRINKKTKGLINVEESVLDFKEKLTNNH